MKDRYIELLQSLKQSNTNYVKGDKLAGVLNVTTRTVRNYVKDLNDNYLKGGWIETNTHKGYCLKGHITELECANNVDYEERAFQIVKCLLKTDNIVTYEDFANRFFFSSQTIRKDVQKLNELIQSQSNELEIKAIIFKGIQLKGNEVSKRLLLAYLMPEKNLIQMEIKKIIMRYFYDWTTEEDLINYISIVEQESAKGNLMLSMSELLEICLSLTVSVKRIKQGHNLTGKDMKLDNGSYEESSLASKILKGITRITGISFNKYEKQYLSYLLISLQILPNVNDPDPVRNSGNANRIENDIRKILAKVSDQFELSFTKHESFIEGLIAHINKSLNPIKYKFLIKNPFLSQIKTEYINAYNIAVVLARELKDFFKVSIPENEIGYLALHIEAFLEKRGKKKRKAAILYSKNQLVGQLFGRKISLYVPEIEIKGIYAVNQLKNIPDDIEVFIITVPVPPVAQSYKKHFIAISEFMTSEDIKKIKTQLSSGLIENFLIEKRFFSLDENDREGFLKTLTIKGHIEILLSSILDREKMSGTEIGHGVAMPHPIHSGGNENLMIFVSRNKRKIKWGSEWVQLVFLIIPPRIQNEHYQQLFSEMYEVLRDSNLTKKLINARSYQEFMTVWHSR